MKKKRIIITITIIIISIILLYFVKVQVQNSAAKEIINNLASENYMYTKTVSSELNNEKTEIIWEGTITAEPYVGIETCVSNGSALSKIYSYEENGAIYQRMQIQSGQTGNGQYLWTPKSKGVKLNQMYTAHNLKYKYEGKIPEELKYKLQSSAEIAFNLDKEMDYIRNELFETQNIQETKDIIVNKIMENIHNLYYHGNNEQMAEYNNRFLLLYREGNIKKLSEFNIELEATLKLYSA